MVSRLPYHPYDDEMIERVRKNMRKRGYSWGSSSDLQGFKYKFCRNTQGKVVQVLHRVPGHHNSIVTFKELCKVIARLQKANARLSSTENASRQDDLLKRYNAKLLEMNEHMSAYKSAKETMDVAEQKILKFLDK